MGPIRTTKSLCEKDLSFRFILAQAGRPGTSCVKSPTTKVAPQWLEPTLETSSNVPSKLSFTFRRSG
jgi:disulfide oxidoreductase YuzD